jgi:tRNA U38,U39,U40 pseudouridine synthase TruA
VVGELDFTSFAAVDAEKSRGQLPVGGSEVSVDGSEAAARTQREAECESPVGRAQGEIEAGQEELNHRVREGHEGSSGEGGFAANVRTIFASSFERVGEEFVYSVRGNGFLHHMVRNLVGTFLLVGKGTLAVEDIGRILEARNRSAAGATAPASGLCLVGVEYE